VHTINTIQKENPHQVKDRQGAKRKERKL